MKIMKLAFKVTIMKKVCIFYFDFVTFHYATTSGIITPNFFHVSIKRFIVDSATERDLDGARNDHVKTSI